MANRPKRELCPPKRYAEEQNDLRRCNAKKKSKTDKNLYDIEIVQVDKERKRLKIHFVGFGNQFDEWRDFSTSSGQFPFVRVEKSFVPGEESLEDRRHIFHGHLYRAIKRKMWSSRREDPEVRIELPIEPDVFSCDLGQATKSNFQRGKNVYHVQNNRLLDDILGSKWDERIFNSNGDFAFVENGTARYWITKKTPVEEHKYIGGKLVKSEIEDTSILVFTFVRGDGNRRSYMERN